MDGTLIQMNFMDDIKRRIFEIADSEQFVGERNEHDDLEVMIAKLSSEGQKRAKMAVTEILQTHVDNMAIQEGGPELVAFLAQKGIRRAVLTHNHTKNAIIMQQMYMNENSEAVFDLIIGRDSLFDSSVPPQKTVSKEQRIYQICESWGCNPTEVIMVGDSIADDVVDGNRAGCAATILLQPEGYHLNLLYGTKIGSFEERTPTLCVKSLMDVKEYLECIL